VWAGSVSLSLQSPVPIYLEFASMSENIQESGRLISTLRAIFPKSLVLFSSCCTRHSATHGKQECDPCFSPSFSSLPRCCFSLGVTWLLPFSFNGYSFTFSSVMVFLGLDCHNSLQLFMLFNRLFYLDVLCYMSIFWGGRQFMHQPSHDLSSGMVFAMKERPFFGYKYQLC
jgi:hypothetical protein